MRVLLTVILLLGSALGQEILRPTAEVDPGAQTQYGCSGTNQASATMPNAYDASGLTTSSAQSVTVTNSAVTKYKNRVFYTWQSTGNTYTALTLNANASSSGATITGGAFIMYSTNAGATWTTLKADNTGAGFAKATYTAALSASQDLSKLKVSACVSTEADIGLTSTDTITIWDIWTSGTISGSVPAGTGTTSGLAHRGVIFTF